MTKIPAADAFESRKTMELTPFAFTFADTALRNQKAGFELQFNLLQNALIGRHNEKIEEITTTSTTLARRIDDLSERQQSLLDSIPALQEFRQGNLNNAGALEKVFDEITVLFETFNTDATVDAAEVAAFQAQRDLLADRMERLYVFSHPDINDAQVVKRLKEDIDSIRALEVTAGRFRMPCLRCRRKSAWRLPCHSRRRARPLGWSSAFNPSSPPSKVS